MFFADAHNVARAIDLVAGARVERKLDGAAEMEFEGAIFQFDEVAFLHSARHEADGRWSGLAFFGGDAEVEGMGGAAGNAPSATMANESVVSCAACDGEI